MNIGAATTQDTNSTGALVTPINNRSSSTRVTASTGSTGKLVFTAPHERNIMVTLKDTTARGYLGLDTAYFIGTTAIFRPSVNYEA